MTILEKNLYMEPVTRALDARWPDNRAVHIVCHGHSVPAGYFATPYVSALEAYPHRLYRLIKERFPYAVVNVIVTAVGGENSASGAARFQRQVLCHRPDVVTIDYALNDRDLGLAKADQSWRSMIESAIQQGSKVILLTPTWEQSYFARNESWEALCQHARQIRALAEEYGVGLADSFAAFARAVERDEALVSLLSHVNHPSAKGHQLVAEALGEFFLAR